MGCWQCGPRAIPESRGEEKRDCLTLQELTWRVNNDTRDQLFATKIRLMILPADLLAMSVLENPYGMYSS